MLSAKDYIFIFVLVVIPIVPSLLLSSSVRLEADRYKNDLFRKRMTEINSRNILWLDARSQSKYDDKHIPGAILVSSLHWEESLARLFEVFEPGQTIVVYCDKGCFSSRGVASRLRSELGQDNIFYLDGGMESWFQANQ